MLSFVVFFSPFHQPNYCGGVLVKKKEMAGMWETCFKDVNKEREMRGREGWSDILSEDGRWDSLMMHPPLPPSPLPPQFIARNLTGSLLLPTAFHFS